MECIGVSLKTGPGALLEAEEKIAVRTSVSVTGSHASTFSGGDLSAALRNVGGGGNMVW